MKDHEKAKSQNNQDVRRRSSTQRHKKLNKLIEENFPYLKKDLYMKIQEAYRIPNRLDPKTKSSWHIIIKTLNIQTKESILLGAKEKGQVTLTGRSIRITPDF